MTGSPPSTAAPAFDLDAALHRVAHWLPTQGPIKDFVHHNTLHAFQSMRFHDATAAAARLYGARMAMPGHFFLEAYRSGRISDSALDRALGAALANDDGPAPASGSFGARLMRVDSVHSSSSSSRKSTPNERASS